MSTQIRKRKAGRPKGTKRKYTNGVKKLMSPPMSYQKDFINSLDFRTELYHSMDYEFRQIVSDLGGEDNISAMEKTLAERLVFVSHLIKDIETKLANNENGEQAELTERWWKLNNSLNSIISKLGVSKRIVSGKSNLKQHLEDKYAEE